MEKNTVKMAIEFVVGLIGLGLMVAGFVANNYWLHYGGLMLDFILIGTNTKIRV